MRGGKRCHLKGRIDLRDWAALATPGCAVLTVLVVKLMMAGLATALAEPAMTLGIEMQGTLTGV